MPFFFLVPILVIKVLGFTDILSSLDIKGGIDLNIGLVGLVGRERWQKEIQQHHLRIRITIMSAYVCETMVPMMIWYGTRGIFDLLEQLLI